MMSAAPITSVQAQDEGIDLDQEDVAALTKWCSLNKLKKNKLNLRSYRLDLVEQCIVASTQKIKRPRICACHA